VCNDAQFPFHFSSPRFRSLQGSFTAAHSLAEHCHRREQHYKVGARICLRARSCYAVTCFRERYSTCWFLRQFFRTSFAYSMPWLLAYVDTASTGSCRRGSPAVAMKLIAISRCDRNIAFMRCRRKSAAWRWVVIFHFSPRLCYYDITYYGLRVEAILILPLYEPPRFRRMMPVRLEPVPRARRARQPWQSDAVFLLFLLSSFTI